MKKLPLLMLLMISNLVMGQESETVNKLDKKNEFPEKDFCVDKLDFLFFLVKQRC